MSRSYVILVALLVGGLAGTGRPLLAQEIVVEPLAALPVPLAGGALLDLSDTELLYVGGNGWDGDRKFFSSKSYLYDVTAAQWRAGPDLPNPLAHAVAVKLAGQWFLIGGEDGQHVRDDLLRLRRSDDGWTWDRIGATPFTLAYGAAASDGTHAYLVGGADTAGAYGKGGRTLWIGSIDEAGDLAWRRGADFPGRANSLLAASCAGGRLYVLGGYTVEDGVGRNSDEVFSFGADGWRAEPPLPMAMRGMSSVALADRLFILGGWTDAAVRHVRTYDLAARSYATHGDLPDGTAGAAALAHGPSVYLAGSEDRPRHRTAQVVRLSPKP